MTHSLYFKIVFKDYNDGLREFISEFKNDEEFLDTYQLKISRGFGSGSYRMIGDSQPFIYFSESDDEEFVIDIETGSHVAPEDRLYSLQWYYFTLAFTDRFEDILKELGAIWYYHLEGDDDVHLNEKQMLKKIND